MAEQMKKVHCIDSKSPWGYLLCGKTQMARLCLVKELFSMIYKHRRCHLCNRKFKESK